MIVREDPGVLARNVESDAEVNVPKSAGVC
jgi:hypothetical protein